MTGKVSLPPPNGASIFELIDFIWDNGLGNAPQQNGDPVPWNAESLEAALDEAGYPIDKRSIENWRSRAFAPGAKSIPGLARVASGGDLDLGLAWRQALNKARTDLRQERRNRPGHGLEEEEGRIVPVTTTGAPRPRRALLAGASVAAIAVVAGAWFAVAPSKSKASATDIHFCTVEEFDELTDTCPTNRADFPAGTQKVMVSFQLHGLVTGTPWERRWYRNGEQFLGREDFYDVAWPGYTWLFNPQGHDLGEYAMRIIIDGEVFTGRFTMGAS